MFKKFKDKLAEEVKSSPQRIQQFAQAAQAAVNSASSSISDITNNDLFSIGENDTKTNRVIQPKSDSHQEVFESVALQAPLKRTNVDAMESTNNYIDSQRHRRLSNSSFASDVSFRLPSYESPAMYHLQSDMDVSASEAEERGLASPGGAVSLDHVTKDQLYSAYRRTQDRYGKYRARYADLTRHYKVLERENAKARSVLVETQDKALRRISELREQCSLEQSAKAHLESALRVEIDEKNMKIESLSTQIKLLQENSVDSNLNTNDNEAINLSLVESQLIDLTDEKSDQTVGDTVSSEVGVLNNKIEKMEQLLNKYKDSLKTAKDRNSQLTIAVQMVTNNLENKVKENEELKSMTEQLFDAQQEIQSLKENNEDLQNKLHAYDFNKIKEIATLESDLKQANEEILQLNSRIEIFNKREEEYAISLAENKLSIHKELESKENEIKSLKDGLSACKKEVQSLNIIIRDYKHSLSLLEEEKSKLNSEVTELNLIRSKFSEMDTEIQQLKQKCETQESLNSKTIEELKCLQLQLKQETAEKLAMIDRNDYLQNRNKQISEETVKKNLIISKLEKEVQEHSKIVENCSKQDVDLLLSEKTSLLDEINIWKGKYITLESEIQEERIELVKLQSEIEKLLRNHEMIQSQNCGLHEEVVKLNSENKKLQHIKAQNNNNFAIIQQLNYNLKELRSALDLMSEETRSLHKDMTQEVLSYVEDEMHTVLKKISNKQDGMNITYAQEIAQLNNQITNLNKSYEELEIKLSESNKEHSKAIVDIKKLGEDKKELIVKLKEYHENKLHLVQLQENNDKITEENDSLKKQLSDVSNNLKAMENVCNEVQKVHNKLKDENNALFEKCECLKQEKETLYEKVLTCEQNCSEYEEGIKCLEHTITEKDMLAMTMEVEVQQLKLKVDELEKVNIDLQKQLNNSSNNFDLEAEAKLAKINVLEAETSLKSENFLNLQQKFTALQDEYDTLKEERCRLLSDIEGLQIHLQKVSKDNTLLNDQLREVISGSEASNEKLDSETITQEVSELKTKLQEEKQKLNDLLRENSVLVEKNLELQDCINSHHLNIDSLMNKNAQNTSNKDLEIMEMQEKYKELLNIKMQLETKLAELELLGRSDDKSVEQLLEMNEKLKMTNEKLERRLDEALVSLRHFRALEESTELEYLRNILYEYLTGSGLHSETLAKVLSAVVKFDDKQTQIVMQREKERQGLLRQLGLL